MLERAALTRVGDGRTLGGMLGPEHDVGARVAQGEPGTSNYREGVIVGYVIDQLWHIAVEWDSGEREFVVVLSGEELTFLEAER